MSLKQEKKKAMGRAERVATVSKVERLTPRLLLLQVRGDGLREIVWSPGDKVKFDIGDGETRSYTPSRWDAEEGLMECVIHLHGKGAASAWASRLEVGEEVRFVGPSRSMPAPKVPVPWAMFFGDETAIGLAQALVEGLPQGIKAHVAIEVEEGDARGLEGLPFAVQTVLREQEHGSALLRHLQSLEMPEGEGIFWLSGEADSVLLLRRALLAEGVARERLLIKPYWSTRGKEHRKRLEKGALLE